MIRRGVGALALALSACHPAPSADPFPGPVRSAEFGVFYGGQVQERDRIPRVFDRAKQSHGFRLEFDGPLAQDVRVAWQLDMPGTTKGVRDLKGQRGRGRLVKLDEASIPKGRDRFDQVFGFEPGAPLGMWNIRVTVEDGVVIDRAFEVVPASE